MFVVLCVSSDLSEYFCHICLHLKSNFDDQAKYVKQFVKYSHFPYSILYLFTAWLVNGWEGIEWSHEAELRKGLITETGERMICLGQFLKTALGARRASAG